MISNRKNGVVTAIAFKRASVCSLLTHSRLLYSQYSVSV